MVLLQLRVWGKAETPRSGGSCWFFQRLADCGIPPHYFSPHEVASSTCPNINFSCLHSLVRRLGVFHLLEAPSSQRHMDYGVLLTSCIVSGSSASLLALPLDTTLVFVSLLRTFLYLYVFTWSLVLRMHTKISYDVKIIRQERQKRVWSVACLLEPFNRSECKVFRGVQPAIIRSLTTYDSILS